MWLATPLHKNFLAIEIIATKPGMVRLWFSSPQGNLMALKRRRETGAWTFIQYKVASLGDNYIYKMDSDI